MTKLLDKRQVRSFFKFISMRHDIWYNRYIKLEPPPWTKDKILAEWKFTNIYRLLDRGTLYLHNVVYPKIKKEANKEDYLQLIFLNTVFYRLFNRIDTIEALGIMAVQSVDYKTEIKRLRRALYDYQQEGGILFTNAHMVASLNTYAVPDTPSTPDWGRDSKYNRFLNGFKDTMIEREHYVKELQNPELSAEDTFHLINQCAPGIGHFVGYEIWCDLIRTPLLKRFDENSFVNVGPGAHRGLDFIANRSLSKKEDLEALYWLRDNHAEYLEDFPYFYLNGEDETGLTLRAIEHSLCEAFKYFKKQNESGRPRNPYKIKDMGKFDIEDSTNSYLQLLNKGLTKDYKVKIV